MYRRMPKIEEADIGLTLAQAHRLAKRVCDLSVGSRTIDRSIEPAKRWSPVRVVDASVFPKTPGFFIASAVYMVSEKASEVIIEDARAVVGSEHYDEVVRTA